MPTAAEMRKIKDFTARYEEPTADAMRCLFILTEHDHPPSGDLILAAMQEDEEDDSGDGAGAVYLSPETTKILLPFNLVYADGTVPDGVRRAIKDAVALSYLYAGDPEAPDFEEEPGLSYVMNCLSM